MEVRKNISFSQKRHDTNIQRHICIDSSHFVLVYNKNYSNFFNTREEKNEKLGFWINSRWYKRIKKQREKK